MALSPMKKKVKQVARKQAQWEKSKKPVRQNVLGVQFEYMTKAEIEQIDKDTKGWTTQYIERAGALNSGRIQTEVTFKGEPIAKN